MSSHRILMVNLPFSGHTYPTLQLARLFVESGQHVTYIHSPAWKEQVESTGAVFVPYDDYPPTLRPLQQELQSWGAALRTVERIGKDFDCLVYEMLFLPGKSVADRLGIPSFRLFSTFALNKRILGELGRTGGPYLTAIFRFPALCLLISKPLSKKFSLRYPDIPQEMTRNAPDLNFVYTTRSFQIHSEEFDPAHYKFVGPAIGPRTGAPLDFQRDGRPLVFVSMGTLVNSSPRPFRLCIEAFRDMPVQVVMAIGTTVDPAKLGPLPGNFTVREYVPQLEVLPEASVFVTHAGMNSVNEAIYYGTPMLALPLGNDQPAVARRIQELGLGLSLTGRARTAQSIRAATLKIMRSAKIKRRMRIAQAQSRAASGNRSVVERILESLDQQAAEPNPQE